jgi:hypothetical protein
VKRVPAHVANGVRRAGADLGTGFRQLTFVVVAGERSQEGRERAHHWIARRGCLSPGGYRRPIGLVGGSRLSIRDPRVVRISTGHSGYRKPTSRSVGNGETQTQGPGCRNGTQGPCDVEVREVEVE